MNLDGILQVTGAPGVLALLTWLWLQVHSLKKDVENLRADMTHQRAYSAQTREMVSAYVPHPTPSRRG